MTETSETWLSQEAYDRLQRELDDLRDNARARISRQIEEARAHGDIRENAEYHAAKDEQGQIEARIRQLELLLREARIGEQRPADEVAPGVVVTLDIEGDEETYLVGSREDQHDVYDVLSASSPIGQAIMGAQVDDRVTVEAPGATYEVRVADISPASP